MTQGLKSKDVKFISQKINLSSEKVKILVEEPQDLDLLLEQISKYNIGKTELADLSYDLQVKLLIYKNSHHLNYDIKEKSFVAAEVSKNLPKMYKTSKFLGKNDKPNIKKAGYFLTLAAFHKNNIINKKRGPSLKKYISHIDYCYRQNNRDVANHSEQWVEVLSGIDWTL